MRRRSVASLRSLASGCRIAHRRKTLLVGELLVETHGIALPKLLLLLPLFLLDRLFAPNSKLKNLVKMPASFRQVEILLDVI